MHGTVGTIVGIVIAILGFAGLGAALSQMMTHADPNGAVLSAGGLAVFVVASLCVLVMAYRS